MNGQKNSIIIACYEPDPLTLDEVLAGIEEEGGLFETVLEIFKSVEDTLARKASKQSSLGAGIGIYKDQVAIAFNTQIGLANLKFEQMTPRQLGQNATRYTKNRPFI
ncbi:MAG: hypothetical protein CVU95_03595 [Firmicutes bacterium HGW-Firmicutes-2]|jgi:hypothetical protein|nr:MAG: hypothetical protein CVU95_03595 [Firmicutes bacterium HGW-Firmicutes-2]